MNVGDPIEELQSTKLYAHLARHGRELADRITLFVKSIAPLLATTKEHFPLYTRHDAHHGFEVTKRIAEVVLPACHLGR